MPYDLFISYLRRDNQQKRLTEFVERIGRDFESLAGQTAIANYTALLRQMGHTEEQVKQNSTT